MIRPCLPLAQISALAVVRSWWILPLVQCLHITALTAVMQRCEIHGAKVSRVCLAKSFKLFVLVSVVQVFAGNHEIT